MTGGAPGGELAGVRAVVTGPSLGGLGYFTALELARRGASVVLAGRRETALQESARAIHAAHPDASLERAVVDLADLASVRRAGEALAAGPPVHLLVNNAGVMGTPRTLTADGLELQIATNHVGPFLLTGLLLPRLVAAGTPERPARVVTVASLMHRIATGAPEVVVQPAGRYEKWTTYGRTKLANLLFTYELDRRLREAGLPVLALAAHPGFAGTHLAANGQYGRSSGGIASILDASIRAVSQSAAAGALPTLMAATADLAGGTYVGPGGTGELAGVPRVVGSSRRSHDAASQRALWEASEAVTGLRYP